MPAAPPPPAPDPPTRSLRLAPGVRVVERGLAHVQVGMRAGCRVVLPRTAVTEAALAQLTDRAAPEAGPEAEPVLDRLVRAGCAVPRWQVEERARARAGARVAVAGTVPGHDVADLVLRAGLTPVVAQPTLGLAVFVGEGDREALDPWVRGDVPHLVVRLLDGGAVLGPFVEPGLSPCLRCLDAHLSAADRDHVAVAARYLGAGRRPRADGLSDHPDAALTALVLAWAVRDLAAHAEGRTPSTAARTIELGDDPGAQAVSTWTRHPDCGCTWPAGVTPSGRMEDMSDTHHPRERA